MLSSLWRAGIAGLFVLVVAGCSNSAGAVPHSAKSSANEQASARTWQGFASECPTLTAPPYGVAAKGKRITSDIAAGERESLDKEVPGAVFDQATCRYTAPGKVEPMITVDVKIFTGTSGTTQATTLFQSERAAGSQIGGGVDNADVPGLADGAFAVYFEPSLRLHARSGNAYLSIDVLPGMDIIQTFDKLQPLQQQVPALTSVAKDALTGLK